MIRAPLAPTRTAGSERVADRDAVAVDVGLVQSALVSEAQSQVAGASIVAMIAASSSGSEPA
jgi:hypothetical protein